MPVTINGTSGITTPGIDASGTNKFAMTIGVGGATPAASGAGVTFPATLNASSNANTLDDYEEGTFSATWWSGTNGAGTNLGTSTNNIYTRIGRVVVVNFNRGGVGSGNTSSFTGLPFSLVNGTESCTTADSCFGYGDATYPTAISLRTADGQFCRGTLVYQVNT